MSKRIPNPSPAQRQAFGLVAWLEQTKITLPLKAVECAFQVCGDVVSVELDQVFQQNSPHPLDCQYTFPLPAGAAVYRCEMHVDGRVVRARVEERERARELAREKKAAGHRTALVEMERDNLFTLSLGNVQPGEVIVIRFAYFQVLSRLGDWTSFGIPFCPGIRYIPGAPLLRTPKGRGVADDTDEVPDASRISPPRIDALHPDAARLSVGGTVEHPRGEVKDISSPSHPVLVRCGEGSSNVAIADGAAVPDCDFILRWTEVESQEVKPSGWVARGKKGAFALIRLRAPAQTAAIESYAQDIYFLIDRSGSMQGLKWQKAVQAFREFLKALGQEDRVWATFFESGHRDLAEKPLPASELLCDAGVQNLEALGANGGTELAPALAHVLEKLAAHASGRPASLLLITDGQVGNEQTILRQLASHPQLRVHVFGIDTAINDGFLQKLAAQHHGSACLLSPQDDIAGAVRRLGERLRRPVLTSIGVPEGWELAGQGLPDLHAGEVLSLPLKAARRKLPVSESSLMLEAKLPDGEIRSFAFDLVETDAAALPLLWAKRRIDFLLAKGQTTEALTLAKENNLVCDGAAFIAWDEAEKVPVSGPEREVYQPSLEPRMVGRARMPSFAGGVGSHAYLGLMAPLGSPPPPPSGADFILEEGLACQEPLLHRSMFSEGVMQDVACWRKEMEKDPLFQTPVGAQLLDCLDAWARSGPKCLRKLEDLLSLLRQASKRPAAERLELVRKWIARHLKDEYRKRAGETLLRLEAELSSGAGAAHA